MDRSLLRPSNWYGLDELHLSIEGANLETYKGWKSDYKPT